MSIEFTCPRCGAEVEADDERAGRTSRCPACESRVMIPVTGIRPGMMIGNFRMERRLGVGGMGEVWLAYQRGLDRHVALKLLAPALTHDPAFVRQFRDEVRMAARLEHPHITTAYDAGEDRGVHYLAMSFVDGRELAEMLREEGPLPESEALRLARQVADALHYAWKRFRILHRDVKPDNMMVTREGEARLMDMGISKSVADDSGHAVEPDILGTPEFMSPEQVRGDAAMDFRADMYSLGASLYEMLTGRPPFQGDSPMAIMTAQLSQPLLPPRSLRPELSAAADELVCRMLAKRPEDRFLSWEAALASLDRCAKQVARRKPARKDAPRVIRVSHGQAEELHQHHPVRMKHVSPVGVLWTVLATILAVTLIVLLLQGAHVYRAREARQARERHAVHQEQQRRIEERVLERQRRWLEAEQFDRRHAGQPDAAIPLYEALQRDLPDTVQGRLAAQRLKQLRQEMERQRVEGRRNALRELRTGAERLAMQGHADQARNLMEGYDGPYADDLQAERRTLAEQFARQWQEEMTRRVEVRRRAAEDTHRLLAGQAPLLLVGRFAETAAACRALLDGLDAEWVAASELPAALAAVEQAARLDAVVLQSYADDKDREVMVPFGGQRISVLIQNVTGDSVLAQRRVGAGRVGLSFSVRQLPVEERLARAHDRLPENALSLCAMAHAVRLQRFETARDMAGAAAPWTPFLLPELQRLESEYRATVVRDELRRLLARAGAHPSDLSGEGTAAALQPGRLAAASCRELLTELERFAQTHRNESSLVALEPALFAFATFLAAESGQTTTLREAEEPPDGDRDPPQADTPPEQGAAASQALRAALKALNPAYRGEGRFIEDEGKLVELEIRGARLRDISPLEGLPLRRLVLVDCPLRDLSPLSKLPLEYLDVSRTWVEDLTPLRQLSLSEGCYLSHSAVTDLSPLKDAACRVLAIDGCPVRSLKPLRSMKVRVLYITPASLEVAGELDMLRKLESLEEIGLDGEQRDARPVQDFWQAYDAGWLK